jgi:rhamnogalacturonan endolyase
VDDIQRALWQDALERAKREERRWPYAWLADANYPTASERGTVTGQLVLHDPFDAGASMSNVWVGVTAPDWLPPQGGFGWGRRADTNRPWSDRAPSREEGGSRGMSGGIGRNGMPLLQDWQRDAKHYQFWARADEQGRFTIPYVRPGNYWLRAIADGVIGEFAQTNVVVEAGGTNAVGRLTWSPRRYGRTVWQIGVPDRTAREFRHGDHYWQWGLYFKYVEEFPDGVNFVIGKSDWSEDWNYVQPPRITRSQTLPMVSEDDDEIDLADVQSAVRPEGVESSVWSIRFDLREAAAGRATLRLAFCGTHQGTDVEVLVNGETAGRTGTLPSTSAMQRDGIRAFWIEKPIPFDAARLKAGENVIQLKSHADSWSQGVMYDCVRLELGP